MTVVKLIFTDLTANSNKFWEGEVEGSTVTLRWGRVGDAGQSVTKNMGDSWEAEKFFERKKAEKLKKGYTEQRTVGASNAPQSVSNLREVARAQIDTGGDAETRKLIDFLVQRNIHRIEGATDVKFDAATGQLTTPLGPVTSDGLDDAEALLEQIAAQMVRGFDLTSLTNRYCRIIPQKIARRAPRASDIFPDLAAVQSQKSLIDAMRQVVTSATQAAVSAAPQVFRTKLVAVPASDPEFDRIAGKFRRTSNRNHTSSAMKLKRVWKIEVQGAEEAFAADGAKVGNVKELWHGTKDANLLSLLKSGYVIPRRGGTAAITGRAFGDGVYFSDQSTKSLNYATGFWGGGRSSRCFMLLNDVAMGREYSPRSTFSGKVPAGYDSTFAKAGGVFMNNEMIVYRTSQIRPKYLCEFE